MRHPDAFARKRIETRSVPVPSASREARTPDDGALTACALKGSAGLAVWRFIERYVQQRGSVDRRIAARRRRADNAAMMAES